MLLDRNQQNSYDKQLNTVILLKLYSKACSKLQTNRSTDKNKMKSEGNQTHKHVNCKS